MHHLKDLRVAVLVMDGFEESELTEPAAALKKAGAKVEIISSKRGEVQAFRHFDRSIRVAADRTFEEIRPGDYDALQLPGGALNADTTRMQPKVREIIRNFFDHGKPVAAICHAPWELISAGVVRGRRLTGYYTIQDDIRNAGGEYLDQEVVVDDNLVTSRQPSDLPAFNREMVALFARVPAHR